MYEIKFWWCIDNPECLESNQTQMILAGFLRKTKTSKRKLQKSPKSKAASLTQKGPNLVTSDSKTANVGGKMLACHCNILIWEASI